MNGYGTGTIDKMYPLLGVGTIKPSDGSAQILFTAKAIKDGPTDFDKLSEKQAVQYHLFGEKIADVRFAESVQRGETNLRTR